MIGKRPAALAAVVTAATMVPLAMFGGVGFAKTLASAAEYEYGPSHNQYKITICHHAGKHGKQHTISVGASAWKGHRKHGDTMGACPAQAPKHPAPVAPTVPAATPNKHGDDGDHGNRGNHGNSGDHGNNGNHGNGNNGHGK